MNQSQTHPPEGQDRQADGSRGSANIPVWQWRYFNNPTTYLGLGLAVCGGAPILHFYNIWWASAFVVCAIFGLLALVNLTVRGAMGDRHARTWATASQIFLVTVWISSAAALFTTGDRAAWMIAGVIPFSWVLHILFTGQRDLRTMLGVLSVCALPLVSFLLISAWLTFDAWIAIPASFSAIAMCASIAASANWSSRQQRELRNSMAATQAAKERLEFVLEAAGDGFFELDFTTMKYTPNETLARFFGQEPVVRGLDELKDRIHPDDFDDLQVSIARSAAGDDETSSIDLRAQMASGEYRWVQVRGRVLKENGSRIMLGVVTDLQKRKQMEEELRTAKEKAEASSKAKSEFLANMSHEIRTPLNGVLGMAQALDADDLTPDQKRKVAIILDSGKALTGVLNDVLDLSKIEAGKLDISPVPGDLLHTMKRVRQLFQTAADEKGLTIGARYSAELPQRLVYDPVRVRQCVSNLLSNAVKFTPAGSIEIGISSEELADGAHMVKIDVVDTGIGMTVDVQEKLFAAFTQADGAITRSFGGTGLGLAISRRLARMMGGDLTVESVPGTGSTFTLTFRAEVAQAEAPAEAQAAPQPASGASLSMRNKRVLLTDDNAVNRQVIKLFMAPLGCQVTEATNGKEALDALATQDFDIVLMDVHMPVMDGTEAIRRIRAADAPWKGIPVIALTADAMSGDRERYIGMGMTDYVSKPVDQRELSSKMLAALNLGAPAEAGRKAG